MTEKWKILHANGFVNSSSQSKHALHHVEISFQYGISLHNINT